MVLALGSLLSASLPAQTIWDGGGADNNWSSVLNWNNDQSPANPGDVLQFAGSTRLTPNVNIAWTVNGLQFNNGAGAFTLGGLGLTVRGNGLANLSSNLQTINNAITADRSQTWLTGSSGGLTVNGAVSLLGSTLTTNASGSTAITLSGAVSGLGALQVTGGNTTLSGSSANTYSGLTSVLGGTLSLQKTADVAAIAGNALIGNGSSTATLQLNAANQIADAARITFGNGGTTTLNLNNNNETIGGLSSTNASAAISLGSATLTVGSTNNLDSTFTGTISGTGQLVKAGSGTLTLTGNNTYTGNTTINLGTLKLGSAGNATATPLGTPGNRTTVNSGGALDLNGVTLAASEPLFLTGAGVNSTGALVNSNTSSTSTYTGGVTLSGASTLGGAGNIVLSGVVSGANALTKTGAGTLTLTGANTNSSSVTVSGGNLTLSGSGTMTSATGFTLANGGSLVLNNSGTNNTNRIGDTATVTGNGGTLNFLHSGTASTDYAETIGNVTFGSGHLNILTSQAATGETSRLTLGNLTRAAGGTLLIAGAGIGTARNEVVSAANLASSGGILRGALMLDTTTGTYNLVNPASANTAITAVTSYVASESSWSNSNTEARPTSDVTLSGNRNVNALLLDSGLDILAPNTSRTLTFGNAGMLVQTGGSSIIGASGTNEVQLVFGNVQGTIYTVGNLTLQRGDTSGLTGSAGIVKAGAGTFINQTDNANTGALVINEGTWRAERAGAVSSGGVTANGGVLELANNSSTTFTNATTTVNRDFTLRADRTTTGSGTGITHTLDTLTINNSSNITFTSGANVTSGTIGLSVGATTLNGSDSVFTVGSNTALTVASITGTNRSFILDGGGNTTVTGSINTGTGTLTKNGSGTLTLSGSNNYTGATVINGGTVAISSEASLGTNPVSFNAGQLTLNGGVLRSTASLTIDDTNRGVLIGSNGGTFSPDSMTTLTIANPISGPGQLVKSGSGNLTLSGSNTFDGGVAVNTGTLTLSNAKALGTGTAGTTVASDAALVLSGSGAPTDFANNGMLTIAGTGVSSSGVISDAGTGSSRFLGNITLSGNATIKTNTSGSNFLALGFAPGELSRPATDSSTLSLGSNTLTLGGGTSTSIVYLNSSITGTGGLTLDMASPTASVFLTANQNTYTGLTKINQGTLLPFTIPNYAPLDNTNTQHYGINGNIQIGDGESGTATLTISDMLGSTRTQELINYKSRVTMFSDGVLNVQSTQTLGGYDAALNPGNGSVGESFVFNGGTINIGANGGLYLMGNVKVNATAGQTVLINGVGNTLSLTQHQYGGNPVANADRVFDVAAGTGNTSDITINAKIMNGSITKTGNGVMTITGNNTEGYEGTTTINNGIIAITNEGALGQGNLASARTIVGSGGTLRLAGTLSQIGTFGVDEHLTLNGTGYNSLGALQNESGTNRWNGPITLGSNATVQSSAGLLTIAGTVTSATNSTLTVTGSGNTTISGAIGTGSGGVTKNGTGTLFLSGANTYSGTTTVNNGVLSLQSNSGLGSATGNTTVMSGATLQLSNAASGNLTTLAEPLFINGTGYGSTVSNHTGALQNSAGNNSFGGTVTLQSASTITAATGTTMTIRGGITGTSSTNLTIGGTGFEGTVAMNPISGSISGTVGQTNIAKGTFSVGGTGTATLNTGEFSSASGTTLVIGSGGTINSHFDNGQITQFSGVIGGSSAGTFALTSANDSASGLQFNASFTASNLTLKLGGSSVGGSDLNDYFRLELSGVGITVGTLHITGDTILDFNNSANTFLSSTNLIIDAGVKVRVEGWTSLTTAWYVTDETSGITGPGGINPISLPPTQYGTGVLPQVTFNGYNGLTTTWVSGTPNGWLNHEIRPTPEPATYGAIFLGGCLGVVGWRRYRRSQQVAAVARS
jgi:autotransporter-associated beta strand protein